MPEDKDKGVAGQACGEDQYRAKYPGNYYSPLGALSPRESTWALAFSFSASHAQEIGVLRLANTATATGNLVLPFEEVMGHPGYLNNPLEHDVTISQAELEDMRKNIFTEQEFIS
jgi:hypothetical protein